MKKEYDLENARRGAVLEQKGKTRITIYLDNDILDDFRTRAETAGHGYQTMINDALREFLANAQKPLDELVLRRVMREELERAAHN